MKNSLKLVLLFIILLAIISCNKDKSFYVPVTGKVVDSITMEPIENARVIYNATTIEHTDVNGEFFLEYNLEKFLADSIAIYVTKNGYWDNEYSTLVGNTQKDVFLIELLEK